MAPQRQAAIGRSRGRRRRGSSIDASSPSLLGRTACGPIYASGFYDVCF